ncbi:hypothetical protein ACFSQP_03755 [Bizionia sediminis]|uniref:DUF4258 domain-containing protein n=1 Tax=Bizionia sediminis TaxID=1737064 RepID=A0ABW5KSP0_9FLAO
MKLLQRVGYYLGGFSIGLIILAFFLSGKKVSCDYGPEARVLKNINTKTLHMTPEVKSILNNKAIDSITLRHVITLGSIHFSKSEPRKKPCGVYFLESRTKNGPLDLKIENCDSVATIIEVSIPN